MTRSRIDKTECMITVTRIDNLTTRGSQPIPTGKEPLQDKDGERNEGKPIGLKEGPKPDDHNIGFLASTV